jgi:hypothetical protein
MKSEIVIARYNEDLSWLKKIPKTIKITIYNKGLDNIEYPSIKLPNIGRESHTYLYHIINNYDNLADQTIFCQGDSIFHSPGFINLLKNRKLFEPIQPLSAFYWPEGHEPFYFSNPPKPILDKTHNLWIKGSPIHVEYFDNNFVTRYPYLYNEHHFVKLIILVKKLYNINNVFEYFVKRFRLKNVDLDDLFPGCYAGLFSVNREVIHENSVDFYNNILSMILYDLRYDTRFHSNHIKHNKETKPLDWGLFMEKLWLVIFNYKKNNKNYISLKVKDYPIYNYNLTINHYNENININSLQKFKTLTIKNINKNLILSLIYFKLYIITCNLYINLLIDKESYTLNITKNNIFLKHGTKKLLKYNPGENKDILDALKDMNEAIVEIKLYKNILTILVNKIIIINYTLKNVFKIENAKIFSLTDDYKFIDLLNPESNNKELEKYID